MNMREQERGVPPLSSPPTTGNQSTGNQQASVSGPSPAPHRPKQLTIPPPNLDDPDDEGARRVEGSFAPEQAIDEQIADLEGWARDNVRSQRREIVRFWVLRGLAFTGAAAATAAGAIGLPTWVIGSGAMAALAVAIDAAWPASTDQNARRRAVHDLRELQHTVKLKWDKVRLAYPDPNAAKRVAHALALLDTVHTKREEIGRYLGDASPGVQHRLSG